MAYPMNRLSKMCLWVAGRVRQARAWLAIARKDGTNASKVVWQYLRKPNSPLNQKWRPLPRKSRGLGKPIVLKEDIKKLEAVEIAETQKRGVEEFKYDNNDDMLQAMGLKETV